jgi:hypothetical protein
VYIPATMCDVCRVGQGGMPNECPVALFREKVVSVRLHVNSVSHGRQQINDLVVRYFVRLLTL